MPNAYRRKPTLQTICDTAAGKPNSVDEEHSNHRPGRNATFSLFQVTDEEFDALFPEGRDMEVIESVLERLGEAEAGRVLAPLWSRPVVKSEAHGIHGTLFYEYGDRLDIFPATMREVDWDEGGINQAQRELFRSKQ